MRKTLTIALFIFICSQNLNAAPPDTSWTKYYGKHDPILEATDVANSVQQTSDGGYIVAGRTPKNLGGQPDVLLLKVNSQGDSIWLRNYGGGSGTSHWDEAHSVLQTPDGGYFLAGFTNSFGTGKQDVYLVRTDSLGDSLWTKTYGGVENDRALSAQQTNDGGFIIAGLTESFGANYGYVWLLKTDSSGDTSWTRQYGYDTYDKAYSVQQTSDAGYIMAGETTLPGGTYDDVYLIKTDSIGDTLWTKTYGLMDSTEFATSVQQTNDGGYIVAGFSDLSYNGSDKCSYYLLKTDSNGDTLWTKLYGGPENDWAHSVQQTSDGGYIIAGESYSFGPPDKLDIYIVRTDSIGDTLWTKVIGGAANDGAYSIQQTNDGGYIVAGYTNSFGFVHSDVYLVKLEPESGVKEDTPGSFSHLSLFKSKPNPFNHEIQIEYGVQRKCNVNISVYNVLGEKIGELINKKQCRGVHTLIWDGKDNANNKISSGIYFLKVKTGKKEEIMKIIKVNMREAEN